MKKLKKDWQKYLETQKGLDYLIADPPWNFQDKPPKVRNQLDYVLWADNDKDLAKLFMAASQADVKYMFIWCPNSIIPNVLATAKAMFAMGSAPYVYKTMVTWVKTTKTGKLHFGLGNWFRQATEQLVVLAAYKAKPFRIHMRNVCMAPTRIKTGKPRILEAEIVRGLDNRGYYRGVYLFSGTEELGIFEAYDIDLIDVAFEK